MSNFPWNPNESLGLPAGSVRAILTMMITFGYMYMTVRGIPIPQEYLNVTYGAWGLYLVPRVTGELGDFLTIRKGPNGK